METIDYEVGCVVLMLGADPTPEERDGFKKYLDRGWNFLKMIHIQEANKVILVFGKTTNGQGKNLY